MSLKIGKRDVLFLFLFISVCKVLIFIFIKLDFFSIGVIGGGNDANYYHGYAKDELLSDEAVNVWPEILRFLDNNLYYDRDLISCFLLAINIIFIPFLSLKLIETRNVAAAIPYLLLIIAFYPTLFFYTFDIYRDVFMVFIFLVGCLSIKYYLSSIRIENKLFFLMWIFLISCLLFLLRKYLGFSFVLAFLLAGFSKVLIKNRFLLFFVFYIILLFLMSYLGFLDSLIRYRSGFTEGGTTLGLDFSNGNIFIPNFILSFLGQLLGLYITTPLSLFAFLVETLPIIFMVKYILNNFSFVRDNSFLRFLTLFFLIYSSIWLIGNDNLGTALRLRIYNYFSVYICFFYIINLKLDNQKQGL